MPGDLARACPRSALAAGQDARAALARRDADWRKCARLHRDTVRWYAALRKAFKR